MSDDTSKVNGKLHHTAYNRVAYVRVSTELLQQLLFPHGYRPAATLSCSLPPDIEIIGVDQSTPERLQKVCRVYVEGDHPSIPRTKPGDIIPEISVEITTLPHPEPPTQTQRGLTPHGDAKLDPPGEE